MARHATESRDYGQGRDFTFHGKFKSKLLAKKREREIPGSFIKEKGGYFFVLKPRTQRRGTRPNPHKATLIYESITRVEGTKGTDSLYPGQKFYHNFKRPYPQMWGLPNGQLVLVKKR